MGQIVKVLVFKLIYIIDFLYPKNKNKIVFNSYPDFTDNAFTLSLYVIKKDSHKVIWLVDEVSKKDIYIDSLKKHGVSVLRIVKKNSLRGLYEYVSSKYIFFTHGIYTGVRVPKGRVVVNLWHGMPIKSIGLLDAVHNQSFSQDFTYTIATSPMFRVLMSKAFAIPENRVLLTGQPRNDLLINEASEVLCTEFGINQNADKVFLWMPTYRQSIIGDIRVDGAQGLPLLSIEDLDCVNKVLSCHNRYLIIKLHPMDILTTVKFKEYSNIQIITNVFFEKKGIQIYELLSEVDVLISDYSSVIIDFLLTNKPIYFALDDYSLYANRRGILVEEYLELIASNLISSRQGLITFFGQLKYSDVENRISLNSVVDSFSKEVYEQIICNSHLID